MRYILLKPLLIIGFVSLFCSPAEVWAVNPDLQPLLSDQAKAVLEEAKDTGGKNFEYPVRVVLQLREESLISELAGINPIDPAKLAQDRADQIQSALAKNVKARAFRVSEPVKFAQKGRPDGYWVWVDTDDAGFLGPIVDTILKTQTVIEYLDIEQANVSIQGRFFTEKSDRVGPSLRLIRAKSGGNALAVAKLVAREQKENRLRIVSYSGDQMVVECFDGHLASLTEKLLLINGATIERLKVDPRVQNPLGLSESAITHREARNATDLLRLLKAKKIEVIVTAVRPDAVISRVTRRERDELRKQGFTVEQL